MAAQYNFTELAVKHGFNIRETEKACRISDILGSISEVGFLQSRLCLHGGTALNFIYTPQTLRLSVDLDFNYRHEGTKDWGQVRTEIDQRILDLLYKHEYTKPDVTIDPSYPLSRITVQYTNSLGAKDNFKIETGYMRRTPILRTDTKATFRHIATQETFQVHVPAKEELFASKWFTMLSRTTSRDLFDVHQISKLAFNHIVFRKCAIIESFTQEEQKLYQINAKRAINSILIDTGLRSLLQTEQTTQYDFQQMKKRITGFSEKTIANLTKNEIKAIDQFYDAHQFEPHLVDQNGILNDKIREHPAILWTLQKLGQAKNKKDGFGAFKRIKPFAAEDELDTHD